MNIDKSREINDAYRSAVLANTKFYNSESAQKYAHGAPHLKHMILRKLYAELAVRVYDYSKRFTNIPRVLDLGAGEGTTTLRFLELGARVTAVDISENQLEILKNRCSFFNKRLNIYCQDAEEFLSSNDGKCYDIIVVSSFLHHIPDYLGLVRKIIALLPSQGQFFSFQDPLRYDSVSRFTRAFSDTAYFFWRIFQGDIVNGIKRRVRRACGIYLDYCESDNAEYHVVRNGVDQNAISVLLDEEGFLCEIIPYFSAQNLIFQSMGCLLKFKNTFAVLARRI